ncbi:MAG: hypothetical protein H0T84_05340 [Tatlockia sp.]|nr:hypothetical protein [Tatlockia sp.]
MQEKISFDEQMNFIDRYIRNDFAENDNKRVEKIKELQKKQTILFLDEFLGIEAGKELETTRIGYPPSDRVKYSSLQLAPEPAPNRHLSRYRLVYGPVDFYFNENPTQIPVISTCAPNLNSSKIDLNTFYKNKEFNKELYKKECEKLARFIVSSVKVSGQYRLIMPAFGLGVYLDKLDNESKIKAKEIMYKAFAEEAEKHKITINWIVWKGDTPKENQQAKETEQILKSYNLNNIKPIVHADILTYAKECKENGQKVVLLNPGSDRTIGGQYHMRNKKTLEEQIAQQSDLLFLHSEFNQPMVEQFKNDIFDRRKKLVQVSTVQPSAKPTQNENKSSFEDLMENIKDLLTLDKGTRIQQEEGNYLIVIQQVRDANTFINFLSDNQLMGQIRTYTNQDSVIPSKNNFYFVITPDLMRIIDLKVRQALNLQNVSVTENIQQKVATNMSINVMQSPTAENESYIDASKPHSQNVDIKILAQQIHSHIKEELPVISKVGDNYKLSFKSRNAIKSFHEFLENNDVKGKNGQPKTFQQDGQNQCVFLTSVQLMTISKVYNVNQINANVKLATNPQNVLSDKINCEILSNQIKSYVEGIKSIEEDTGNFKFFFKSNNTAEAFSEFLFENSIKGQGGNPKRVQKDYCVVLTHNQCITIKKMGEVTEAIANEESKPQKQGILIQIIQNNIFSVTEFNMLYNLLKKIDGLNTHTNVYIDKFFGIENTTTWRNTLGQLRTKALETLFKEVEKIFSHEDKITFLEQAKTLPLFKEHRNNSFFSGAWGRTASVIQIEEKVEEILSNSSLKR